jgi:hypothetical protein
VLIKYAEAGKGALGDAEGELSRTLTWLEHEQSAYWAGQIRKRQEMVARTAEKLREKRTFKDATGRLPSAVDEEKAWKIAKARLEEAEAKAAAVKKYVRVLQKAADDYKGSVQGFASTVAHGIPMAVAKLDKLADILRQYVDWPRPAAVTRVGRRLGRGRRRRVGRRDGPPRRRPPGGRRRRPARLPRLRPAGGGAGPHPPPDRAGAGGRREVAGRRGGPVPAVRRPSRGRVVRPGADRQRRGVECAIYAADKTRLAVVAGDEPA